MTNKLPVKEHLRNAVLYQPLALPSHGSEWKRRLFARYRLRKQLNDALYTKFNILQLTVCIVVPVVCLLVVFASYFGFLHLGHWFENIEFKSVMSLSKIGLKEILVFAAVVNLVTFLIMKRKSFI